MSEEYWTYWESIPIDEQNAVSYEELCAKWGVNERKARQILHDLSSIDNGDDYILIRSSRAKGFFRTSDRERIEKYKRECLNKGRSNLAPVKKINRVLNSDDIQHDFFNNLRVIRESKGMKQKEVCQAIGGIIDVSLLSRMENGVVLPTPRILCELARLYGVRVHDLIMADLPSPEEQETAAVSDV